MLAGMQEPAASKQNREVRPLVVASIGGRGHARTLRSSHGCKFGGGLGRGWECRWIERGFANTGSRCRADVTHGHVGVFPCSGLSWVPPDGAEVLHAVPG